MRSRAPFSAQLRVFHQNISCSMHTFPLELSPSGCPSKQGRDGTARAAEEVTGAAAWGSRNPVQGCRKRTP